MELDGRRYPEIDDAIYRLQQDLYQANPSEVCSSPIGDNHTCLPGTHRREFSSPVGRLYDSNALLSVSQFGVFLLRCRAKPHTEVLSPHVGRDSGAM